MAEHKFELGSLPVLHQHNTEKWVKIKMKTHCMLVDLENAQDKQIGLNYGCLWVNIEFKVGC